MSIEENERKIKGASALDSALESIENWPAQDDTSFNYASCPDAYKQLIEDTDLDKLVYWKLKDKLEKQAHTDHNEVLKGVIADVERPLFAIVLNKTNGNQSKAAEVLGCNRNTLHRKLKEFYINPRDIKQLVKGKKKSFYPTASLSFKNKSRPDMIEM